MKASVAYPIAGLAMALALHEPLLANNLTVSNLTLSAAGAGKATVGFDISWDNSWKDSTNFDAAWVFVKYSVDAGYTWRHATLGASGTNPAGFSSGSNPEVDLYVPADKKGAFVQRNTEGSGTLTSTGVELQWDFAANGNSSNVNARVRVMAIEMVHIPAGPFYVGDDSSWSTFYVTCINTNSMTNTVASAGAGTIASPYTNAAGLGRPYGVTGTFDTNYPNGYNAFYLMKYEISQGQYADFLNTLTVDQAKNQFVGQSATRDTVTGTWTNFTASAPNRACWFNDTSMAFSHAAAYVDWAALRPITEMEFEKAARGPGVPVNTEYAWGSTVSNTYLALANDGTSLEAPSAAYPNANVNQNPAVPDGPIRCGAFATNGSSRVKSGGSFYGVMELSGNTSERVIPTGPNTTSGKTTGASINLTFSGVNGDGELDGSGYANVTNWPGGNQIFGHRGGGFAHDGDLSWIANRRYGGNDYTYSWDYGGCRGARAP